MRKKMRNHDMTQSPRLTLRGAIFLALLVPVWLAGVVRGERITSSIAHVEPFFAADLARFERLRPQLAGTDQAFLLLDRPNGFSSAERFFPAQYSLAPTVLHLVHDTGALIGAGWKGEPLTVLCAFDDPARLVGAMSALAGAAQQRTLSLETETVDSLLILVRIGAKGRIGPG